MLNSEHIMLLPGNYQAKPIIMILKYTSRYLRSRKVLYSTTLIPTLQTHSKTISSQGPISSAPAAWYSVYSHHPIISHGCKPQQPSAPERFPPSSPAPWHHTRRRRTGEGRPHRWPDSSWRKTLPAVGSSFVRTPRLVVHLLLGLWCRCLQWVGIGLLLLPRCRTFDWEKRWGVWCRNDRLEQCGTWMHSNPIIQSERYSQYIPHYRTWNDNHTKI